MGPRPDRVISVVWAAIAALLPSLASPAEPAAAAPQAEIFVQLGHTDLVRSVAFSPDGRMLASVAQEGGVKLWDVASGREIRTLQGSAMGYSSVAFSADGKLLLAGGDEGNLELFDVATAQKVRSFRGHSIVITSVALSADGRQALSGAWDETMRLWDVAGGGELRRFTGNGRVEAVAFSPDGSRALSGHAGMARVWDLSTGRQLAQYRGHGKEVQVVAFSPDGKRALSGSNDALKLWDPATGAEQRALAVGDEGIEVAAWSPDGRSIVGGGFSGGAIVWNAVTGARTGSMQGDSDEFDSGIGAVAYSADGRLLAVGHGKAISLHDATAGGARLRDLQGRSDGINTVAFSADGRQALSGSRGQLLMSWDLTAARGSVVHTGTLNAPNSIAFSSDARLALLAGGGDTDDLVDVASGKTLRPLKRNSVGAFSAAFAPDGRLAATATEEEITLWSLPSGSEAGRLKGHTSEVPQLAFSQDGRWLVSGSWDKTVRIWDVAARRELRVLRASSSQITSIAVSADGRFVAAGDFDESIKLWDANRGTLLNTLRGHTGGVAAVAFTPDGRYLLSASADATLKLWDVSSGRELRSFAGHARGVESVAISPDGGFALSGSLDSTTRLWNLQSGEEVARLIGFVDGEWIVLTPRGYYTSSASGDKYVNVRVGNSVYGVDQYRSGFYRPQILEATLQTVPGTAPTRTSTAGASTPPAPVAPVLALPPPPALALATQTATEVEPPFVVIRSPEDGARLADTVTEVSLRIEDRKLALRTVKLYVNGRMVTGGDQRGIAVTAGAPKGASLGSGGIELADNTRSVDLKVPATLDRGSNLIEVVASNGQSESRSSARLTVAEAPASAAPTLPKLWILSIGVNRYQDPQIPSLAFPARDADAILRQFKTQEGRLFSQVNTLAISDDSATKPTYSGILDSLNFLSRASQYDVVLLFLAGHGMNDERGDFYFLPSDAALAEDGSLRRSKAVSWRDIRATLDLPAKVLVFVDSCHSEGVSGNRTRSVDNDRLVKELQDANAVVFTSSRGRELSQEGPQWMHGAFTYALVQGLSGKADLVKDGRITMKELDAYVSEVVPQITGGAQHPITFTPDGYVNFPLSLVNAL